MTEKFTLSFFTGIEEVCHNETQIFIYPIKPFFAIWYSLICSYFFYLKKICFVHKKSRFLFVFVKLTDSKSVTSSQALLNYESYTSSVLWQTFLKQRWKLEISRRPFFDFIQMRIKRDLAFNSRHLSFLIVRYSSFHNIEHWNLDTLFFEYLELVSNLKKIWNLVTKLQII